MEQSKKEIINDKAKEKQRRPVLPQIFKQYAIVGTFAGSLIFIYGIITLVVFQLYGEQDIKEGFIGTLISMCVSTYQRSSMFTLILGIVVLTGALVLFSLAKITSKFVNLEKREFFQLEKPLLKIRLVYIALTAEALMFAFIAFFAKSWLMLILLALISLFFSYIGRKVKNIVSGIYLINKRPEPKRKNIFKLFQK